MNQKKPLPIWAIAASVAAALILVAVIFVKGGEAASGPSRDELIRDRQAQDHPAPTPVIPPTAAKGREAVGNQQ